MALPVNINDLINGRTVEWERIEFKEGWNPTRILKTICAFANDFNNWSGGYVVIGINEENGIPVLPPVGLTLNTIDEIQQELNNVCRRIIPNYFPIVEPVDFQDHKILILWCPGGSNRPYKAPESLGQDSQYFHFIRKNSSTVRPTVDEERELFAMANNVPFDDQINHRAQITDFNQPAIKNFLTDVGSDLKDHLAVLSPSQIARQMNIAEGADEHLLPKNVGLLFFANNTQQFFPSAKIEIVTFENDSGDSFTEKTFPGNLHTQLLKALSYLKENLILEKVSKVRGKAEADRFFNYPYEAIEEALCNAVYHRGYNDDSTIEMRIFPNHLSIISYPGPLLPLDKQKLIDQQFDVRKYRNRRIGEFLKELHLTEGRATGVPTIKSSLERNGSPAPIFETDDTRTYFKTTLKIHPAFIPTIGSSTGVAPEQHRNDTDPNPERDYVGDQVRDHVRVQVGVQANFFIINNLDEILTLYNSLGEQAREQVGDYVRDYVRDHVELRKIQNLRAVLKKCEAPQNRTSILSFFNLVNNTINFNSHVAVLLNNGILERTIPDKPKSSKQKYRTTEKGKKLLEILR
ncbi:MAG: putative DNA binding domain-containing protein [Ignavibacteria bacterium]|nr:putative DNA binding domain-containing protein [Ignavibacteria bacterium]